MHAMFITLLFTGLLWFCTAKRKHDVYTLAFISACVYFLPGVLGYVNDPVYFYEASGNKRLIPLIDETYIVMSVVLFSIWCAALLWDQLKAVPASKATGNQSCMRDSTSGIYFVTTMMVLSGISLLLVVWSCGASLLSANKDDFLQSVNRWYLLWSTVIVLLLPAALIHRHTLGVACGSVMLVLCLYFGSRSEFAISVITCFLAYLLSQPPSRILHRHLPTIVCAIVMGVVVFTYKSVQWLVKIGDYESVLLLLCDSNTYATAISESEPFVTQCILNEVLDHDFHVGPVGMFTQVGASIIPFGNIVVGEPDSFNSRFQAALFPDVGYGMASNCWAQAYSSFGWMGVIGLAILFNVVIWWVQSAALKCDRVSQTILMAAAAYWAFYFHRNDIGFQIAIEKRVLLIGFGCVACKILTSLRTTQTRSNSRNWASTRPVQKLAITNEARFHSQSRSPLPDI